MFMVKRQVFLKFYLSFFLLTVLLICSIGLIIYSNSVYSIEKEISREKISRLNYFRSIIEDSILKPASDYVLQKNISYSIGGNGVSYFENKIFNMNLYNISEIYKEFNNEIRLRPYIESINMYSLKTDIVISSKGLFENSERFPDDGYLQYLESNLHKANGVWSAARKAGGSNSSEVITYTRVFPFMAKDKMISGFIYVNVYVDSIYKLLEKFNINESEAIVIADSNMNIIFSNNFNRGLLNQIFIPEKMEEEGFNIEDLNGINTVVSHSHSGFNDWYYITLTPIHDFYQLSTDVKQNILLTCTIVFLLGLVLSYFMSNRLYNPIKRTLAALNLSTRDDAEKNEFVYINERVKLLSNTIDDLNIRLKDNKYFNYLYGKFDPEKTGTTDDLIKSGNLVVMLLKLDMSYKSGLEEQVYRSKQFIENRFSNAIIIPSYKNEYIFIINYNDTYEQFRNFIATNLKQYLDSIGLSFNVGVGNDVPDINSLHISFENAKKALRYMFIKWKDEIVFFNDIRNFTGVSKIIDYDDFTSAIKGCNIGEIKGMLDKIIEKISYNDYTVESMENIFFQIISCISNVTIELNLHGSIISSNNLYHRFYDNKTIEDAVQWTLNLCQNIISMIKNKTFNNKDILCRVKSYIDDNLVSELSLYRLSEIAHLSPAYISSLFKEQFNMGFSDYVTNAKLAKASELLRETDKKIKDIMEEVGYNNLPYFTTRFKQKYGFTPHSYKMQHARTTPADT